MVIKRMISSKQMGDKQQYTNITIWQIILVRTLSRLIACPDCLTVVSHGDLIFTWVWIRVRVSSCLITSKKSYDCTYFNQQVVSGKSELKQTLNIKRLVGVWVLYQWQWKDHFSYTCKKRCPCTLTVRQQEDRPQQIVKHLKLIIELSIPHTLR